MRAFVREGAQDFDDDNWLVLIHEGSNKMRMEYCKDRNGSLCYLRATQRQSGGIPICPELMNCTLFPSNWKGHIYHRGVHGFVNPLWRVAKFPEEKKMTGADNQSVVQP